MKTQAIYQVKLPEYSLPYLINGDGSGLNDFDKKTIDNYMAEFYQLAESYNGDVVINVDTEESSYFTWKPAFGLACEVHDAEIAILSD